MAQAYWIANVLNEIRESARASDVIHAGRRRVGSWTRLVMPRPGFPWFAVGMANHYLVAVVAELMDGRLYSPSDLEHWEIALPFTTLDQVVGIGPTQDLIGHPRGGDGRGAFTFDQMPPKFAFTYPSLWSADSETQQTILTPPTHEGSPAANDETLLKQMLDQRSDLFISRNLRLTSQALAAARTGQLVMGGRGWTALLSNDDDVKAALSIWLNSSLALMLRTSYAQTTQPGRAAMQVRALAGFPVPDFAADSDAGAQARAIARQHIGELAALELRPASYAFQDANRRRVDSVALEMVGLGENQQANAAIDALRQQWCREPSVHGGNRAIMRALGVG